MKALVVYDSYFGNTEQIARAIGAELSTRGQVETVRVSDVKPEQLAGLGLLVVGSPTRGFRPSPPISTFLKGIARGDLDGVRVAAFDTRITPEETGSRVLGFMVKLFGYAAEPIHARLVKKGGTAAAPPAGFIVVGREGPLKAGELERAAAWARQIATG